MDPRREEALFFAHAAARPVHLPPLGADEECSLANVTALSGVSAEAGLGPGPADRGRGCQVASCATVGRRGSLAAARGRVTLENQS